jgi:hypothetical protein
VAEEMNDCYQCSTNVCRSPSALSWSNPAPNATPSRDVGEHRIVKGDLT